MILIENEIAFVAVPKCASISMHRALETSDFNIEPTFFVSNNKKNERRNGNFVLPLFVRPTISENFKVKQHNHQTVSQIYTYLNSKPDTLIIKRDYCKRFISAFYYLYAFWIKNTYKLDFISGSIDNDFIYKYFTDDVCGMIREQQISDEKLFMYDLKLKKLIIEPLILNFTTNIDKKKIIEKNLYDNTYINYKILDSQEIWRSGYNVNYIFNIDELYKLENFLFERYEKKIKLEKENHLLQDKKIVNITENQKLRDWVWKNFEKFHFKKTLI